MLNLKKSDYILDFRSLEEVTAEILQLERETEGLLKRLVSFGDSVKI
jgi:hypothetical protein